MNYQKSLEIINKNKYKIPPNNLFHVYENDSIIQIRKENEFTINTLFNYTSHNSLLRIIFPSISVLNLELFREGLDKLIWCDESFRNEKFTWKDGLFDHGSHAKLRATHLRSIQNLFNALDECDITIANNGIYRNKFYFFD